MADRIIKIAIELAAIILAIAALWYAAEILSFSSLSEVDAKSWLKSSEWVLFGSAFLLAIGLAGEWPDSDSWKKRLIYKAAKCAVIIGVLGELLGDAGVFETSSRVQSLEEAEISQLNVLVGGRQLTPALSASITAELTQFPERKVFISSYSGDAEAARLGMQLISVFEKSRIKAFNHLGRTVAGPGGVTFGITLNALPGDSDFANALISAIGRDGTIQISDKVLPATIKMEEDSTTGIFIALRPLPPPP
jgi:hypothetical protein